MSQAERQLTGEQHGPVRIVIVDDDPGNVVIVEQLLTLESDLFTVTGVAHSAIAGLQLCQEANPDVVLMDVNLPDMSGFEATRHLANIVPHIGVIAMSAESTHNYLKKALAAGAKAYVTKPIDADNLYKEIRNVYRLQADLRAQHQEALPNPLEVAEVLLEAQSLSEYARLMKTSPILYHTFKRLQEILSGSIHDLRSPLAIAYSSIDMLARTTQDSSLVQLLCQFRIAQLEMETFFALSLHEHREPEIVNAGEFIQTLLDCLKIPSVEILSIDDGQIKTTKLLMELLVYNLLSLVISAPIQASRIQIRLHQSTFRLAIASRIPSEVKHMLLHAGDLLSLSMLELRLYVLQRILRRFGTTLQIVETPTIIAFSCSLSLQPSLHLSQEQLKQMRSKTQGLLAEIDAAYPITQQRMDKVIQSHRAIVLGFAHLLVQHLSQLAAHINHLRKNYDDKKLERALKSVKYAYFLIRNILSFVHEIPLQKQKFLVRSAMEEVLGIVERKTRKNQINIRMLIEPEECNIVCDRLALVQILVNLCRNSIEAVGEEGQIFMLAYQQGTTLRLEVRDNGRGIPQEHHARVFSPGFSSKPGGYGIGLFCTRTLVERLGGSIYFVSRPETGTRFVFDLPVGESL